MPIPLHPTVSMLDSTKLSTYQRCPREFFLHYVLGWTSARASHHLTFGVAWHESMDYLLEHGFNVSTIKDAHQIFLKRWRETYSECEDGLFEPKTPANVLLALQTFLKHNPFDKYEIEHIEIPGVATVGEEGAERTLYVNLDSIVHEKDTGLVWEVDHKTTTQLSGAWQQSFAHSIQVGAYVHTLMSLYDPSQVGGVIINGMVFRKDTLRGKGCEQAQVECRRTLAQQATWLHEVNQTIHSIEHETQYLQSLPDMSGPHVLDPFPKNRTGCIRYGSTCPFYSVCEGCSNPMRLFDKVGPFDAPPGFQKGYWNPSTHTNDPGPVAATDLDDEDLFTLTPKETN